VGGEETN